MRRRLVALCVLVILCAIGAGTFVLSRRRAPDAPNSSATTWTARTPDGQPQLPEGYFRLFDVNQGPRRVDNEESFGPRNTFGPNGAYRLEIYAEPGYTSEYNLPEAGHDKEPKGIPEHVRRLLPKPEPPTPLQPWAQTFVNDVRKHRHDPLKLDHIPTGSRCLAPGVFGALNEIYGYYSVQFVQAPNYVVTFNEFYHTYRMIPLDGRPHIGNDISLWMGDPVGRWDGNTLVIETTNNNGKPWINGHPTTDALRTVERLTIVDADTVTYQITVDDPKTWSRPWTRVGALLRTQDKDYQLFEHACHEGNGPSMENMLHAVQ